MLVGLSVCPSICPYICNKFFSKSVHQFPEILHIDENLETGKMTEVDFAENSLFPLSFMEFSQNFVITFCWQQPKIKDLAILCFPIQTPSQEKSTSKVIGQNSGKICFTSYMPKCAHLVKLQDSLIVNASGRDTWIQLTFCIKIVTKGRQHLRFAFEWLYPVISSYAQTCLDLPRIPFGQFWGHCQIESSSE